VLVDPIKPTLKSPGTQRLKLKYDVPLSKIAFKFNLRRYIKEFFVEDELVVLILERMKGTTLLDYVLAGGGSARQLLQRPLGGVYGVLMEVFTGVFRGCVGGV